MNTPLGKTADILMYAPFVGVYGVPDEISDKLTADEFFGKNGCYVNPNFEEKKDKIIKEANQAVADNMTGDDWPVNVRELLDALDYGRRDQEEFNRWLKDSNDGIFKVLGDAGTGKSTFLHYLQWSMKDIQWHILDLKRAIPEITIFGSSIIIPHEYFVSLHGKVLSAIILEMRKSLFEKTNDFLKCRRKLQELLRCYNSLIVSECPLEEYAELYENLLKIPLQGNSRHKDIDYCKACAKVITKYFEEKCFTEPRSQDTEAAALRCVLTQLLIILRCFGEKGRKELIVFDNIERFIGADEIYNKELTEFLNNMRNLCDIYTEDYRIAETNTNRFAQNYQFIVSMRNTTVRNHIPMEIIDFTRHSIDLSSWFAIGDIIHAKLDWYMRHEIEVLDETTQKHLEYILSDDGLYKDKTLRGLRPKLDLIFNYNKRLITTFLVEELLVNPVENHVHYLESANFIKAYGIVNQLDTAQNLDIVRLFGEAC